jgi:hypothetical protein
VTVLFVFAALALSVSPPPPPKPQPPGTELRIPEKTGPRLVTLPTRDKQ